MTAALATRGSSVVIAPPFFSQPHEQHRQDDKAEDDLPHGALHLQHRQIGDSSVMNTASARAERNLPSTNIFYNDGEQR